MAGGTPVVTVGSLAYSIVANTQNFTAGVAASKAELKTLKDAFLASQTPTERFSMAIEHLESLAQKFPEKGEGIRRTIARMREEMTAGAAATTQAAHGTNELSETFGKIDRRLGRLTLSEVMGTLKEIPGATLAIDIAFGNWIGAAVGAFSMAHKLIEETGEALNKTAEQYESATEKVIQFYEAEERAREKGRARDQLTDSHLSPEAEKAARELGMGQLGYAASNTTAGMGQRAFTWLGELAGRFSGLGPKEGERDADKAVTLGKEQIAKERESRRLAEEFTKDRDKWFEDFNRDWDKAGEASAKWFDEFERDFDAAGKQIERDRLEAVNRAIAADGKRYEASEKKADDIARGQMSNADRLRDEFTTIQELEKGGFFDLHPGAYEGALDNLREKARDMTGQEAGAHTVGAVRGGSLEALRQQFSGSTTEKQLEFAKKNEENTRTATALLSDIKTAIAAGAVKEAV
jgi:hypothetical protein